MSSAATAATEFQMYSLVESMQNLTFEDIMEYDTNFTFLIKVRNIRHDLPEKYEFAGKIIYYSNKIITKRQYWGGSQDPAYRNIYVEGDSFVINLYTSLKYELYETNPTADAREPSCIKFRDAAHRFDATYYDFCNIYFYKTSEYEEAMDAVMRSMGNAASSAVEG